MDNIYHMYFEYCNLGGLDTYIKKFVPDPIPPTESIELRRQPASGPNNDNDNNNENDYE